MRIIPTSAAAASALYMLHSLPVPDTKGRVKLVPRTRHDYSNKSSHRNVRKMLWNHPTKRWKNLSLSKFPHPRPTFLKKNKKKSKARTILIFGVKVRGAILNKISFAEVLSTATDTQEKRTRGKKQEKQLYRLLIRCSSLFKLHDGFMTSFMTI